MNDLITMIKTRSPSDGFLRWLHLLMLMDDTVIIATSRARFIEKMSLLYEYCAENDMLVNNLKTKFMVINGDNDDKIATVDRGNFEHPG